MDANGSGDGGSRPRPGSSQPPQGWGPTSHSAGRTPRGATGSTGPGGTTRPDASTGPGGRKPGGRRRTKPRKPDTVGPDASWTARRLANRRRRKRAKKARLAAMTRSRRYLRRGLVAGTWLLGFIAALMVAVIVAFYTLTDVPRPETLPLPQVATIEYSDGSTLARIGNVDRTIVDLKQVPKSVRYSVLAAEDRSFYSEDTVSVRGTARAALSDVTGGDTQGGSGITQQYVKNAYLTNAPTLSRKLKELMIAVKLSREYSKNQILEFYLNTVYFGRGAYGIGAAAQAFFGVDVSKLSTAQGALLAGLLRAPSYYDPRVNPAQSQGRWHYVLDGLVKTRHLTAAQASTMRFPTTIKPRGTGLGTSGWKYLLVNAVLADLARHGISRDEITEKGLRIRTTIDPKAQRAAVSAVDTNFDKLTKKQQNLKNSLVAVDPANGGVLAYYGGSGPGVKGYDGKVDFNDWANGNANDPGSTFKPYVLATALTQTLKQTPGGDNFAINSEVDGSFCRTIDGTKICNDPSDKRLSKSKIKLSLAMKYSLNTTFDLLALDAGPKEVADTAHSLGVATVNPNGQKSLQDANGNTTFGIGIGDYPVTTLDQAAGYATIANKGVRNDAYFVQEATGSDGSVVYQHKDAPQRVLDPRVANDVGLTLKPIAAYNDDALANGRESAAKTGTEGIDGKTTNNSDAWMVGYTPQVSAAVWVGTGMHQPIYDANGDPLYGKNLPGKTWQTFMDLYLKHRKHMDLPTKQLISENGTTPTSTPTATTSAPTVGPTDEPSPTDEPTTSAPSLTTGFNSPTTRPSTRASRTRAPAPTTHPPSSRSTCGTVLPCRQ